MNISGKFTRVSRATYKSGVVAVGFCGGVRPEKLTPKNIKHIQDFYNMSKSSVQILGKLPEDIEPAYSAAASNFCDNGVLLLVLRRSAKI